jgi:NAD-dependent deacetylase
MNPRKVVVLSGAGVSAASGIATFRDSGGLWEQHRIEDVATPDGWARNPALVLEFYNARRRKAAEALPNAAHLAIAELERDWEVVVVTQNVDDLHERAGSTRVIHLHGELCKARSSVDDSYILDIGARPILLGERCPHGSQLRPHIVWFGEDVPLLEDAAREVEDAGRVVVVGTSLQVYPAAGLVDYAHHEARKYYVDLHAEGRLRGFELLTGAAEQLLPGLFASWKT